MPEKRERGAVSGSVILFTTIFRKPGMMRSALRRPWPRQRGSAFGGSPWIRCGVWRASEDFGWYLKECPGAIIYIGSGEKHPPLHTAEYDFNDRILETAVDLFEVLSVLNAEDSV